MWLVGWVPSSNLQDGTLRAIKAINVQMTNPVPSVRGASLVLFKEHVLFFGGGGKVRYINERVL